MCCFFFRLPIVSSLLMMVWMVIDGTVQLLTPYESKNIIRALSGFLFGFGLFMLFADTTVLVFNYGVNLVK